MFLDNWYKALKAFNTNYAKSSAADYFTKYDGTVPTITISIVESMSSSIYNIIQLADIAEYTPSIYFISNGTTKYGGSTSTTSGVKYGVIIGDGDTAPTISDYCLSGNQITDFTATTSVSSSYSNGKITFIGTYNITNTGASAFTVKELGLCAGFGGNIYLLARSVLENPVTIQPGDTGVVTYKIEIS